MTGSGKTKQISLGDGFGDVAVNVNGASIEIHVDGSLDTYTDAAVRMHPVANDSGRVTTASPAALKPGDKMPDGTVFAGTSPETKALMYTTPKDAPFTCTFNEAAAYAKQLNGHRFLGHDDWRVPTKHELNELF